MRVSGYLRFHSRWGLDSADPSFMRGEPSLSMPTKRRSMAVLAVWMLVLALVAPGQAGASGADESDFVARVNATRASVGLAPLAVDAQLTSLARGWAGQMRDGVCGAGNNICHAGSLSSGVSHQWTKLGENVGTGPSVGDVMPAFIASPSHYANIVDPSFTHIGVGVVWDGGRLYTTHRFMAVAAPPPTTTTTTAPPTTTTTVAPTTTVPPTTAQAVLAAPATTTAPATQSPTATVPRLASRSSSTNSGSSQADGPVDSPSPTAEQLLDNADLVASGAPNTPLELPEVLPTPELKLERSNVVSDSVLQLLSSTS